MQAAFTQTAHLILRVEGGRPSRFFFLDSESRREMNEVVSCGGGLLYFNIFLRILERVC